MSYFLRKVRNEIRYKAAGFISEAYPLGLSSSGTAAVSQRIYFSLVGLLKGDSIANIHVCIQATPSQATTNLFVAIYDSAGTRVAVSNDLTTGADTIGIKTLALSSAYLVPSDGAYYLAILFVNAGTAPAITRSSSIASTCDGLSIRSFAQQSSQSTMPTPSATFAQGSLSVWLACS